MPRVQDGAAIVRGVIKAEDQRAEIGEGVRQESGRVPLTPAQARRAAQDEWTGEETAPGYTHHTVEIRTDRELAERARREADAAAVPPERVEAKPKPDQGTRRGAQAAAAVSLIRDFRSHVDRVRATAERARGDRDREARAIAEIQKTKQLGETIRERLGRAL